MFSDGRSGVRDEDGRTAEEVVVDELTGPLERVCINTRLVKMELKPEGTKGKEERRLLDDVE